MHNYDIVVIGNGVLGLSIAYSLSVKDPSLHINIIGPELYTGSATIAAGAMLNCFAEVTERSFSNNYNKTKFELALSASKMWPDWLKTLNQYVKKDEQVNITDGTYIIHNSESGGLDTNNYLSIIKALDNYSEPYEVISNPEIIPGINPIPNYRPLHGVYIPNEGCINSHTYLELLKKILQQNPKINITNSIVSKINTTSKLKSIQLVSGDLIYSNQVVIANGSYAQGLIDTIPSLSTTIPKLLAGVGYSAILSQDDSNLVKNVIRTPNRAGACGLHVLPRGNKLYVGATNNIYYNPQTEATTGLTHFLFECAITQINQSLYNSTIEKLHIGNRPATIDNFPLIGKTSIEGLWILTGTYRDGFHQSPLLSTHMANLILGAPTLIDTKIFRPERNLISTMTKEDSINEFIRHYIAGSYEHSTKLPKFMQVSQLESMIRNKIEKIYEALDTEFGLTPDMLLMFEFSRNRDLLIKEFREYFKHLHISHSQNAA